MGWPQIVMICLYAIGIGIALSEHGKPKTGEHSFWVTLIGTVIGVCVLWAGGFWTPN